MYTKWVQDMSEIFMSTVGGGAYVFYNSRLRLIRSSEGHAGSLSVLLQSGWIRRTFRCDLWFKLYLHTYRALIERLFPSLRSCFFTLWWYLWIWLFEEKLFQKLTEVIKWINLLISMSGGVSTWWDDLAIILFQIFILVGGTSWWRLRGRVWVGVWAWVCVHVCVCVASLF